MMLKSIAGLPADVLAIEASGQITHRDCRDNTTVTMFTPFFHGEERLFRLAQLSSAKDWITALFMDA